MAKVTINDRDADVGRSCSFAALEAAWDGESIKILPNEEIRLGEDDGKGTHNPFAKMSIAKASLSGIGLPVSNKPLDRFAIVLTLWPDQKIIPARILRSDLNAELEMAENPKKGERCFVVDRSASRLVTVSMESKGDEFLKIVNPNSFLSWLSSCQSNALVGDGRFHVTRNGSRFEIRDAKRSRQYSAKLIHSDDILAEYEISAIGRMLASKGLGALLPIYNMEIHSV